MSTTNLRNQSPGYVVVTTLVFAGVFLMILYSLLGLVFRQYEAQRLGHRSTESLQIAEAGLDWYRWYLAHNPGDLDGPDGEMPMEKGITDPERGVIGKAEIDVSGSQFCGQNQWIDITSTGWSTEEPDITRTVSARYTRPSVARYSFILNSNVWAGSDREINGPYHSNGGIRMDGDNNSKVTSAQEDWECDGSFGCSSGGETKPGVFGGGDGENLWDFPVPQVDFTGITLDLNQIRNLSQSQGVYFNAAGGQSNKHGWHIIFNGDGSFDAYRVKDTESVEAYSQEDGWHTNYNIIADEKFDGTYDLSEDCPVVYTEDKLWVEGSIGQKITIAAAKATNPNFEADTVISDDITYAADDGSVGLTVVSERSIDIPLNSENDLDISGIFIAQNGRFGRDHFASPFNSFYWYRWVPSSYYNYVRRDELSMKGSVVSNGRVGTKWSSGNTWISGYGNRTNAFDRDLSVSPPPLTPFVSEEYELVQWREVAE